MENYLIDIEKQLKEVTGAYNQVISNKKFDYTNWKKNVEILSPIVQGLQKHADKRLALCRNEVGTNKKKQTEVIENRVQLYDRLNKEKGQMSELDVERLKIGEEIRGLSQEISNNQNAIADLQRKIEQARKDKEYWDTVFWATCWIPFVHIGTGVKKGCEDGEYKAKAKVLGEDTQRKQDRINVLANQSREIEVRQKQNHESSGKLADQITATEGVISEVTSTLNTLRQEMALWQNILTACSQINVELQYTNGKIEKVMECFYELIKISDLLEPLSTDKFIKGCICRGDMLAVGGRLQQNEYLLSQNRRFAAVMQSDNNFVVYNSEKALWDTGTWGTQGKGCVELDKNGLAALKGLNRGWDAKRNGAVRMIMQDDGNLVTYDKENKPLWASDTYIYANAPGICFNRH